MIVGVGLDTRDPLSMADRREVAQAAAELGFDSVWTNAAGLPDAFHVCAQAAHATASVVPGGIRTGISVVPAPRWTVSSLAAQAATVADISGGSFVLGIGAGSYGSAYWRSLGLPDRPIAVMREYLTTLHGLFAGDVVTCDGVAIHLSEATLGKPVPVPVYLAALGPAMVRLAGGHADGILLNWVTPQQIEWCTERVREGAEARGRDPSSVQIASYVRVCVDDDEDAARRALAHHLLPYALARPGVDPALGYRGVFARSGFDAPLRTLEARRDAGASADELADAVPTELLRAAGYFGPPTGAAAAFRELSRGLDETIARLVPARPGVLALVETMRAIKPS